MEIDFSITLFLSYGIIYYEWWAWSINTNEHMML